MKIIKDTEGMDDCEFSSQECEDKGYAVFCVTEDRGYNNIKEYVNQCFWRTQDEAESKGKEFVTYYCMIMAVVEEVNRANLVVIFTHSDGYEWYDQESKFGRVCFDDRHISEIVMECDIVGYWRNLGAAPRVMNFRPFEPGVPVPRLDDSGDPDIPF